MCEILVGRDKTGKEQSELWDDVIILLEQMWQNKDPARVKLDGIKWGAGM